MTEAKQMTVTFECNGVAITRTAEGKNPARTTQSVWAALTADEREVLGLEDGDTVSVGVTYTVTVRKTAAFTVQMVPTLVQSGGFVAVK